ncbi:hypothetical protein [Eubacterium sp. 1001713B170207_170306_E7]|uniref:hypothetical protein n=1 Tax=Eubacterium sp. 1001713B170207_170306_E7 TaxID=2787097 RepID=UPI00189AE994|nr:hypothetical protein [Eubacterium sp. 1001713B170207_170306_E7]
MNRLGSGRPILRRKRPYTVRADCILELELWASDEEAAEDQFNEYCEAVQYHHPELVLTLRGIRED